MSNLTAKELQSLRNARSRQLGAAFEELIDRSCEYYKQQGIAMIEKTPEPMRTLRPLGNGRFEAVYTKQAQPDYKGTLIGGYSIVFEAKHTDTDRIKRNVLSEEQVIQLDFHDRLNAECYVLVSFGLKDFYKIPWKYFYDMKQYFGQQYISKDDELIKKYKVKLVGGRLEFL